MLLHEILKVKQPDVFLFLCKCFSIDEKELQAPVYLDWFDVKYEMTHDSDGRYLNYTSKAHKV